MDRDDRHGTWAMWILLVALGLVFAAMAYAAFHGHPNPWTN